MTERNFLLPRAMLIIALCHSARARADDPLPQAAVIDVSAPVAEIKGSYVPGKDNAFSVTGGDGTGALALGGHAVGKRPAACSGVADVTECFVFTAPADGSTLVGEYTHAGRATAKVTLTPTGHTPTKPLADPPAAGPDANIIEAYQAAVDRAGLGALIKSQAPHNIYDGDTAILFFDEKATPLFVPLPQVDEDDSIQFVFVATGSGVTIDGAAVSQCTAPTAVRVGGSLGAASFSPTALTPSTRTSAYALAEHCSADAATEVKVTGPAGQSTATLHTIALYRLTVGVGLLFDHTPITQFNATSVKGQSVPAIVADTHEAGLSAVAMISLHLLKTDFVRPRFGSDIGRSILQALLNPTVGVSLTAPTNHLYLADNFLFYPGFGLLFGYHFYRQPTLAGGYQAGDLFPGGGSVPVDLRWVAGSSSWFIGVDVNTSILSQLLGALNK